MSFTEMTLCHLQNRHNVIYKTDIVSFTKQTQCHLYGGKEGLNHGQALPETDQAEREERIAVHHEPVRPSPVRVQGEDADKSKRGI